MGAGTAIVFLLLCCDSGPFPWDGISCLGIANLLPQIVPVKRETLQVVSLAMTGLVRGWGQVFHIEENKGRMRMVEVGAWIPNSGPF